MIEAYFLKRKAEYLADPIEGRLDELGFIQEERRIQNPLKFIILSKLPNQLHQKKIDLREYLRKPIHDA